MKKATAIVLLLVVLCIATGFTGVAFARGGHEQSSTKPRKVEISGTVRMVGNSPMTQLVISGEDREWYVEPKEENKLMRFQQQIVTVKAQEYCYDRVFANGTSAGKQYFLKKIVVINPTQ